MNKIVKFLSFIFSSLLLVTISNTLLAADESPAVQATANTTFLSDNELLRYILVLVIALFVFVIFILTKAIKVAGNSYQQKIKEEKNKSSNKILSLLFIFLASSISVFAQDEKPAPSAINPFQNWDVYLFVGIVMLLFIVVLVLVRTLFVLMGIKKLSHEIDSSGKATKIKTWFEKINNTVAIEEEDKLDLQHDYDGIRELDNKVPSWWSWTFITTILFGFVYIYRMFIAETMPKQIEELNMANEIAAVEKAEYLKKSANNVDENTVVMLSGNDLAEGASVYAKNCVACHGDKGQGSVGPNLTDDYWVHKGGIKDIFYSVKYGWQEKGMKSWQNDLSPMQMAQVSSFIKSLAGTNPPNPKEKQGELYAENGAVADTPLDSTKVIADTTK